MTTPTRFQGNPAITEWCPACAARVVPLRDGRCGWCDYPVAGRARETKRAYERRLRDASKTRNRAVAAAAHAGGTISVPELADILGVPPRTARYAVRCLRRAGVMQDAGEEATAGRPRLLYALANSAHAELDPLPQTRSSTPSSPV